MREEGDVLREDRGPVCVLTLAGAGPMNLLRRRMWRQLGEHLAVLQGEESIRAVLLRGAEKRPFSAGCDLGELERLNGAELDDAFLDMERTMQRLEGLDRPVIAAVDGFCLGIACQLMLACDLQVCSVSAAIGMPVARLGITIDQAFARRLVFAAGAVRARELLLTGRRVMGEEAFRIGLVTQCVPDGETGRAAMDLALRISSLSAPAVRAAKRAVAAVLSGAPPGQPEDPPVHAVDETDFRKAVRSFMEKRNPHFIE